MLGRDLTDTRQDVGRDIKHIDDEATKMDARMGTQGKHYTGFVTDPTSFEASPEAFFQIMKVRYQLLYS